MQPMNQSVTRRQIGLILGGLGVAPAAAQPAASGTSLHQEVDFQATPVRLYEILLDAKQFAAFTKDTAELQPRAGEPFKLFGGRITGRNVDLAPNRRIVQAWRSESVSYTHLDVYKRQVGHCEPGGGGSGPHGSA